MDNDELRHWGILGMKWGNRRFQNEDGSLTPEGRIRYGKASGKTSTGYHNKKRVSDSELSREDIKKKADEYADKARYYKELNNYINEQQRYKDTINPPKNWDKLIEKLLVEPAVKVAGKFVEFEGHSLMYMFLGGNSSDSKQKANADMYLQWVISSAKAKNNP